MSFLYYKEEGEEEEEEEEESEVDEKSKMVQLKIFQILSMSMTHKCKTGVVFVKAMNHYKAEKARLWSIQMRWNAGIEQLSMIRQ